MPNHALRRRRWRAQQTFSQDTPNAHILGPDGRQIQTGQPVATNDVNFRGDAGERFQPNDLLSLAESTPKHRPTDGVIPLWTSAGAVRERNGTLVRELIRDAFPGRGV